MNFRKATDELAACPTHDDLAAAIGCSVQAVRQARLESTSPSFRNPPAGWEAAVGAIARKRAAELNTLAGQLVPRRRQRPTRSDTELDAAMGHLVYELEMLNDTAELLSSDAPFPRPIQNALIESFVLHARNVLNFLHEVGTVYESDVLAVDFMRDPSAWVAERGELPPELANVQTRANKEMAHLTYDRAAISDDARDWDFPAIGMALVERFDRWASMNYAQRSGSD